MTIHSSGPLPKGTAYWLLLTALALVSLGAKGCPCQPPAVVLTGTLLYDGQPMSEVTGVEPQIWFRDEPTGQSYPAATAEYSPDDGTYAVSGLPEGPMAMAISFHLTGDQPTLPGNYRIFHPLDLSEMSRKERCNHDVDLWQVMHLTEPWENSRVEFPSGTYPTHPPNLSFAWDPLDAAASYELRISEARNPDHPDGYGHIGWVVDQKSVTAPVAVELGPSAPDTHYELELVARDAGGDRVGQIMTTYTNGHGWDYRFRVCDVDTCPQEEYVPGKIVSHHGMTSSAYQAKFEDYKSRGYRPTYVDGFAVGGTARFAAIWEKSTGIPLRARHNMTSSQYQDAYETYRDQGYRLVHVDGYSIAGMPRFAAIWEKKLGMPMRARHNMTSAQYQDEFDNNKSAGYRLAHVSGYDAAGGARFAAIWKKKHGMPMRARHNMTPAQYQSAFDDYASDGYKLKHVSAYTVSSGVRFAAIWEQRGGRFPARHGLNHVNYQNTYDNFKYAGHYFGRVGGYEDSEKVKYAALWESAGISPADLDQIRDRVDAFMTANNVKGLSLAITNSRKLVYAQGFGVANDDGEIVGPRHRFRIGSISKSVTATAIMTLVEDGLLSLDDAVFGGKRLEGPMPGTYYPSPGVFDGDEYGTTDADWYGGGTSPVEPSVPHNSYIYDITVRNLLEHTVGTWSSKQFHNWERDPSYEFRKLSHTGRIREAIKRTRNLVPGETLPNGVEEWVQPETGTRWAYSNFGYSVLGRVVEKVAGMAYEQFVKEGVLKPLGIAAMEIHGSHWDDGSGVWVPVTKTREVSYYRGSYAYDPPSDKTIGDPVDGNPYAQYDFGKIDAPGGWIASVIDLTRHGMQFDETGTVLLEPGQVEVMKTPESIPLNSAGAVIKEYGKGWSIPHWRNSSTPSEQRSIWRHGGAINGSRSELRCHEGVELGDPNVAALDHFCWAILINTGPGCSESTAACYAGSMNDVALSIVDISRDITGTMSTDVVWPDYDLF